MRHTINSYSIAQFQIVSDITYNIFGVSVRSPHSWVQATLAWSNPRFRMACNRDKPHFRSYSFLKVFGTTTEGLWRFTQLSKSSSDMIQQFHELDVHRKLSLDGSNPRFRPIFKDFTRNSTVLVGSLSRI